MSIVILLAVLLLIVVMFRAALGSPHPSRARAVAFTEGAAEGLAEAAGEAAAQVIATSLHGPHVADPGDHHDRGGTGDQAEADDPAACHGYDADGSAAATTSEDGGCDSDSSDWFDADD